MIEFINEHVIANQISMIRDNYRGSFLVVEGSDDALFFDRFLALDDNCRIIVAHGKTVALEALSIIRSRNDDWRVLVVVDADFWHITDEVPHDNCIAVTDHHDLEMILLMSNALDDVLREQSNSSNLANLEGIWSKSLRAKLLDETVKVGRLRFVNETETFGLRFRDMDLTKFVDLATLTVDADAYLSALLDCSGGTCDRSDVETLTSTLKLRRDDLAQFSQGHDFTTLLALALSECIGRRKGGAIDREDTESLLRLAFDSADFELTNLYDSISAWQDDSGGMVLRF